MKMFKNVVTFKNNNIALADLYAIQQTKLNDPITCKEVNYIQLKAKRNHQWAIAYLDQHSKVSNH